MAKKPTSKTSKRQSKELDPHKTRPMKREKVITDTRGNMEEALRTEADNVKKLIAKCDSDVLHQYDVGAIVNEIKSDDQKYGRRSVEKLAAVVGKHKSWLYDCVELRKQRVPTCLNHTDSLRK